LALVAPGLRGAPSHAPPTAAASGTAAALNPAPAGTPATLPGGEALVTATAAAGSDEFALLRDAPAVPRPGQPSRIVIAAIALDARVVEVGTVVDKGKPVWDTAAFAVGYHRGSALPGALGNTVLNGHISSPVSKKGDVFRHLPEVRIGDRVDIYSGDQRVSYAVVELRLVPPTATQVLNQTPDATLTLITCYPDNVYSQRLIVIGKLLEAGA